MQRAIERGTLAHPLTLSLRFAHARVQSRRAQLSDAFARHALASKGETKVEAIRPADLLQETGLAKSTVIVPVRKYLAFFPCALLMIPRLSVLGTGDKKELGEAAIV